MFFPATINQKNSHFVLTVLNTLLANGLVSIELLVSRLLEDHRVDWEVDHRKTGVFQSNIYSDVPKRKNKDAALSQLNTDTDKLIACIATKDFATLMKMKEHTVKFKYAAVTAVIKEEHLMVQITVIRVTRTEPSAIMCSLKRNIHKAFNKTHGNQLMGNLTFSTPIESVALSAPFFY